MNYLYDIVFVTHLPVFYKVNLYNEIAVSKKILVIFISDDTEMKRGPAFFSLNGLMFDYEIINRGEFEKRNVFSSIVSLSRLLNEIEYNSLVLSGWDLLEFWYLAFLKSKDKNCLSLESSIYDSRYSGVLKLIKRVFLSRVSKVYASGSLQKELVDAIGFKGKVVITGGVGIIRKPIKNIKRGCAVFNRIIFIGRLAEEKNLKQVIEVVNKYPWLTFDIYGTGPLEAELKSIALSNVNFKGPVDNNMLEFVFSTADYLILPSKKEPWGLVCEEAVYFSVPVIMTSSCGSVDIMKSCDANIVFNIQTFENEFSDFLNKYSTSIVDGESFISEKDAHQISAYE